MSKATEEALAAEKKAFAAHKRRAAKMDEQQLECRVGGTRHRWVRCKPDWDKHPGVEQQCFQCESCMTIKRMEIGARYGEVVSRTYEYPDWYQLKRGENDDPFEKLMSPAAVRLELSKRLKGKPLPAVIALTHGEE